MKPHPRGRNIPFQNILYKPVYGSIFGGIPGPFDEVMILPVQILVRDVKQNVGLRLIVVV